MSRNPERATERRFVKCEVMEKPGLGDIHVHARPWRPSQVFEIIYMAPGGGRWVVPEPLWDEFLATGSPIEAMALLRSQPNAADTN